MTTSKEHPSTISWTNFMSNLLNTATDISRYLKTAAQYEPENMRLALETVLEIRPDLAPIVISRYAGMLTLTDLKTLAKRFPEAHQFIQHYHDDLKAFTASRRPRKLQKA